MNSFDSKLGRKFLDSVPALPGIYRIYDEESLFVYVGKAKNLRRRLGQYRNAKRRKKHRKIRKIVESMARIEFDICTSELEAELLETRLIQAHRPKWNVVGAFSFLYPMIGMKVEDGVSYFCYTTHPEAFSGFEFHGAFRSREITGDAFFALMKLLRYVGHPLPRERAGSAGLLKHSYVYGFRQLPTEWAQHWGMFWQGESKELLEQLIFALIENAGARQKGHEIQEFMNQLSRFWNHEATPLLKARTRTSYSSYPVSQLDRDLVFLKYRHVQRESQ